MSQIDDYAYEAVSALAGIKIINGYDDGSFLPKGNATRAETAVMINTMLEGVMRDEK